MMNYKPVTEEVLEALRKAVGAEYVMTDPETLDKYKTDEETDPHYHHLPEVVVMPANTEEVAAVMKIANEFDVPVTPRSAGTSVSCGAVPVCGGRRYQRILRCSARLRRHCAFNGTHG